MMTDNDILTVLRRQSGRAGSLIRRLRATCRSAAVAAAAAQLVLGSALPVRAQKRSAEPEANPQFQQQLQPSQGGGPVESGAAAQSEQPSEAAPRASDIQVGAARPERPVAAATVAPMDTRVTVRVHGAPLVTFLDTISAQAKINFIVTEGLESRRVTAILPNVTVREALQVLLEMKGLTYQQIGKSNTYIVTTRSVKAENVITRIYTLSYIPLIPLGTGASEQAELSPMSGASGGAVGGAGAAGGANTATEVAIINVLKSVLTKPVQGGTGGGQVAVEPRTNSLIVTDIPEVFPQVEQIIAELDKKAPQVMIEAQVVEIDSTKAEDLGIEWGGADGELAAFTGGKRDTSFPMALPRNLGKTRFLDPVGGILSSVGTSAAGSAAASASGTSGTSGTGVTISNALFQSNIQTSILDLTSLSVVLRAMVTRTEARFLGKPKILALNNKPAIIQVATNQAVSVQQSIASSGSTSQATTTAERVTTGLILKVTPQINKDGYITMLVQPSYTNVQPSSISSASAPIFDPVSRSASTLVRVKNGQTLVLGGLLESTESKTVRKVPFLGYIPLIGWLFTSTSSSNSNSDLVIFITPTIVND